MRMSRRQGLLGGIKLPTLAELFADMTTLKFANGSSPTGSYSLLVRMKVGEDDTSTPYYCFCSTGDNLEISKISDLNKTQLFLNGTRVVQVTQDIFYDPPRIEIIASNIRGGSILLARFPSYNPKAVDKALSRMVFNVKASLYSSTSSNCGFDYSTNPVNSNAMYIATGSTGGFSVSEGSSILTPIFSTGSVAYLMKPTSGTVYRYSADGSTSSNLYVASIFELLDAV